MAIEYTIMMKSNVLDEQFILDKYNMFGYQYETRETLDNGTKIISFQKNIGFTIYLSKEEIPPHNVWDTVFQSKEYNYAQILTFRLVKNFDDFDLRYETIFGTIFGIIDKYSVELLLVGSGSNDLLYYSQETGLLLNKKNEMWNKPLFKKILKERIFEYIET